MRFSAEWWSYWAGVVAVIATALAAIAGVVSWYFSQVVAEAAETRAREMDLRISEQQERAATAERQLIEVRNKLAPRVLAPEQQERITAAIAPHSGITFSVFTFPGDAEPAALARTLAAAIESAGWTIRPVSGGLLGSATGIVVGVRRGGTPKDFAARDALVAALNSEGLEARAAVSGQIPDGEIKLQVARKP